MHDLLHELMKGCIIDDEGNEARSSRVPGLAAVAAACVLQVSLPALPALVD